MKKKFEFSDDQQGWVKLQRSILNSPLIKNHTLLQTYIWSLLKANHQPKWFSIKLGKGYKEVYCDVGQFITGRNRASDELGIPGSTWYTNITKLKDFGYLEIESNSHYSLITVVNYGGEAPVAMPMEQQKKKQKNNKSTTKKQPNNTNNNNKKENKEKNKLISTSFSNSLKNEKENDVEPIEYRMLKTYINENLANVADMPNQLTYDEFKSLYQKYYWEDIINKLNELEVWPDSNNHNYLNRILLTFLEKDRSVIPLKDGEYNHFDIDEKWYADTDEVDHYIERVKNRKVFKESKHSESLYDMRQFIRQYLILKKAFADYRYPRFADLKPLKFREAIKLEEEPLGFWGVESYIEEMHNSHLINDSSTTYEFIIKYMDSYFNEV